MQPLLQVREGTDQLQGRTPWRWRIRQEVLLRGHGGREKSWSLVTRYICRESTATVTTVTASMVSVSPDMEVVEDIETGQCNVEMLNKVSLTLSALNIPRSSSLK